jgi:hypothetical protein
MTEVARKLDALLERFASEIEAFHNGGPELKREHLKEAGEAGLDADGIANLADAWDEAIAKREVASPPIQPAQAPKLIRRLPKLGLLPLNEPKLKPKPRPQENASSDSGPSKIGEAQNVFENAKATPEPEADKAEQKVGLPAVIPIGKPLTNERASRWNDALKVMNEQHAVIESVGGKTVIASWEPSSRDPNRLMIVYQTKESFLLRYSNRPVSIELEDGKGGYKQLIQPLGQWWLRACAPTPAAWQCSPPSALPHHKNKSATHQISNGITFQARAHNATSQTNPTVSQNNRLCKTG